MSDRNDYSNIKAALFDMDGTLTDTFSLWAESVRELVRRHSARIVTDEEYRRNWWGSDPRSKIRDLLTSDPPLVERYYRELLEILMDHVHLVRPLPGAREAVGRLRRHILTGVISNGPIEFIRAQLAQVGMSGWFAVEVADADPKPSPGGILRACAKLGIEPHEALFVGDSRFDRGAAEAAGSPHVIIPEDADREEALAEVLEAVESPTRA